MTTAPPMTGDIPAPAAGRRPLPVAPLLSSAILLAVVVCAVTGSALAPQNPLEQDPLLGATGPGPEHLLGTDKYGRDVLSQLIAGARTAVAGPFLVASGCLVIGSGLGMVAAYLGGAVDTIVNRLADLIYALPGLLIAVVVVGVMGGGYSVAVLVLLTLSVPHAIRVCRAAAMVEVRLPYVDAARTIGVSSTRVLYRHVLPNIRPTVLATFLLDFVGGLIGFAALSFLGLGVAPGQPDWGLMLAEGQVLIGLNPWLAIAPAVLLILTAASATLLGDWLYERLTRERRLP